MKKIFNPKKPLFWIIIGVILTAIVITIIAVNYFNSVDIGIIGGADGPTSIIVSSKNNNPVFQATILEVNGDLLLVKPDFLKWIRAFGLLL
jgi:Na+-transporting methylmalonyl-CoA/oxaloacetate decarboxylase beta subunit